MNTERLDKLRSDIERINQEIEDLTKHHGAKIEIAIGGIVKIGTSIKYPYIQIQKIADNDKTL